MNQLDDIDNATAQKAPDAEELQLLDAYSLASNFFLFLLIIFLTLTNPGNVVSKPVFILLVVVATCSAMMFLVFSVLMFKPKSMGHFRRLLSRPHKSLGRRLITFGFIFLLWVSLPIIFLAGIVDASSRIPQDWQTPARLAGFLWLLLVPLAAMMVLVFKHNWRLKLKAPSLVAAIAFCAQTWRKFMVAIGKQGPLQFLLIAVVVGIVQISAFFIPVIQWLPGIDEVNSFLRVLWQVHASILGISIIVITIVITVIANEKDRTRTWKLYVEKTKFVPVVWFNLLAIISEGFACLQASHATNPLFSLDKVSNLILSEGILLVVSILLTAMLFTITVKFLDDDYVEDLAEERIVRAMPAAVEDNIKHYQEVISQLRSKTNGN